MVSEESVPEADFHEAGYANVEWECFMNCLDEKYRTVVMLYYVEGFKTREIAEILQVNENSVRGRLVTARKKMEAQYAEEGKETDTVKSGRQKAVCPVERRVWYE